MEQLNYPNLVSEIEELKRKANEVRNTELPHIIKKIKAQIRFYEIDINDLVTDNYKRGAIYSDGKGNVWSGKGRQPTWIKDAISNGSKKSDFLVKKN